MGGTTALAARRRRRLVILALLVAIGAAPAVASSRGVTSAQLTIANRSPHTIEQVYITQPATADWGEDRLHGQILAPGKVHGLTLTDLGCRVDIQVVYGDTTIEERRDVDLCHGATIVFDGGTLPTDKVSDDDPTARDVALVNHAGRSIEQVFISEPSADQWGDERLAGPGIAVGQTRTIRYLGGCQADIRVVFDNRAAEERRDVNLWAPALVISPGWTTAGPEPDNQPPVVQTLLVTNHAKNAVTQMRLAPEGTPIAETHDLLAGQQLGREAHVILPFMRGKDCKFIAQVVYANTPKPRDLGGFDLCHTSTISLPPP